MNAAVESRELITLDGLGVPLRGTYHKPQDALGIPDRNRIGVVFLNSLFLPRTAAGDSAVYWAEAFAALGYPSFRLDLPGLGDTDAPLNTALQDFINAGGYESIASAKVKELVERFGLTGVVIIGHCAGAISAVYAAAVATECKGLVLMDPYFFLPQRMRQSRVWKRLGRWAAGNSFGAALSNIYDWLKDVRLALRGKRPPENANACLLRRWEEVASRGLPILLLKAPGRKTPGMKPRVGEFDYLEYIQRLAYGKTEVVIQLIEGTDHSFANRVGRAAVRQHIENWLTTYFPIASIEDSTPNAYHSQASKSSIVDENRAPRLLGRDPLENLKFIRI
jgi:pimeloyl-ACP methyl ester carboxylesterase